VLLSWDGPLGTILDTIAECQAQLHDNRPEVLEKLRAELESPVLIQAMYEIGYFPTSTPPG
jgi:hypothetical protein